jgi:hypothetical protein
VETDLADLAVLEIEEVVVDQVEVLEEKEVEDKKYFKIFSLRLIPQPWDFFVDRVDF